MKITNKLLLTLCILTISGTALGLNDARVETRTNDAVNEFGVTGKGVTIAVLDRGIAWRHPDFINPDGTTRIYKMLDLSGQNLCNGNNPDAVEYSREQLNNALLNGTDLGMRDAVGHGTSTAGTAAGNGRGLPDLRYMGIAPEADLVIAKVTSEGAVAHDGIPAEAPFQGCLDEAIDWASTMMDELNQPGVLIINSGTQWGPMDGSSAVSRKLAEVFPEDKPGRIVVQPSGDEGSLPNHAKTSYDSTSTSTIGISRASGANTIMSAWYAGAVPAEISVAMDDGTLVGPVAPGNLLTQDGITIINYNPGTEFYPWLSDSGDHAVWISISGHATTGSFQIRALDAANGTGMVDLYGDVVGPNLTPVTSMTDHLVAGRLNDYATTPSAIVVADHNLRTSYIDIDGVPRSVNSEGVTNDLWLKSSGGPTRDGREPGVDLSAPGQGLFAPVGTDSYWGTLRGNMPQDSGGLYLRFGGTSASAPLVLGAVALMLQVHPTMSARQARQILRDTAREDNFTGAVPNNDWGYGKLDVYAAVKKALAHSRNGPWFNPSQSGHGWFVEMLDLPNGTQLINAYWYVYSNGKPAWLLGNGPLNGNTAVLQIFITENGDFPPDFNGANEIPWGTLTFDFNTHGSGNVSWETQYEGFTNGSMPVARLAGIDGSPAGCRSGSYYDPAQSGHGFVTEVVNIGGVLHLIVAWYVYLDGEQVWLLGTAPFANDHAEISLQSRTGAQFPPGFLTGDVVETDWGVLTIDFLGPNNAKAAWVTNQPGYSNGNINLVRLTNLGGYPCAD
ncbi:MAG: S8 family serine peptidase [Xanthomonadales bacterium]|nr:S8 family serine peptidase [Xanthomonadales bacterium]